MNKQRRSVEEPTYNFSIKSAFEQAQMSRPRGIPFLQMPPHLFVSFTSKSKSDIMWIVVAIDDGKRERDWRRREKERRDQEGGRDSDRKSGKWARKSQRGLPSAMAETSIKTLLKTLILNSSDERTQVQTCRCIFSSWSECSGNQFVRKSHGRPLTKIYQNEISLLTLPGLGSRGFTRLLCGLLFLFTNECLHHKNTRTNYLCCMFWSVHFFFPL